MSAQPGGWDAEVVARLLDALRASGYGSITFHADGPGKKLRIVPAFSIRDEEQLAEILHNLRA